MNWRKNATFLSRNCTTRTLGRGDAAKSVDFYAISPRVLFKLRGISRPLAQALSCLFEDRSKDTRRSFKETTDTKEGLSVSETVADAIHPDVLRERAASREKAIDKLIDAFSEHKNYLLLLEIIWDSMRGVFGTEPPSPDQLQELSEDDDLDLPILIDMLKGVAAANFDSLTGWTGKLGKALSERVRAEMETAMPSVASSPEGSIPMSSPTASANQEQNEETESAA